MITEIQLLVSDVIVIKKESIRNDRTANRKFSTQLSKLIIANAHCHIAIRIDRAAFFSCTCAHLSYKTLLVTTCKMVAASFVHSQPFTLRHIKQADRLYKRSPRVSLNAISLRWKTFAVANFCECLTHAQIQLNRLCFLCLRARHIIISSCKYVYQDNWIPGHDAPLHVVLRCQTLGECFRPRARDYNSIDELFPTRTPTWPTLVLQYCD